MPDEREAGERRKPPRGRWAPSPTGWLHLGNARTALVAWLSVRRRGGTFVWRVEDLDPPRVVRGSAEAQQEDLAWLGLDWDEGPDRGGPGAPYAQSERAAHYEAALTRLDEAERLFPCRRSRQDLEGIASAPHGGEGLPPYPAAFRPAHLDAGWLDRLRRGKDGEDCQDREAAGSPAALRFRVLAHPVAFVDRIQGRVVERVDRSVGDFVVKRRDGLYAYQLAVVVDDLLMGIDDVVRGVDLLASTARQLQLIACLGGAPPAYAHLPLVVNAAGEKLSKRDAGLTLRALRQAGVRPAAITGYLAHSLGLLERPEACRPADLLPLFSWRRLAGAAAAQAWRLPADLTDRLRNVRSLRSL
jgi:glutamyl-tRNA synthetase